MRPADVAQAAVLVDERHEGEVGELGHEQLGQARDGVLGDQGVGQVGRDVGDELRAPRGPLQLGLRRATGGDVEEVDRQRVGRRPDAQLVPAVERGRVVRLERA